jgi:putative OPT family oligopeptide transporter
MSAQTPHGTRSNDNEALARFRPYVAPEQAPPEFTLAPVLVGVALGLVFSASSLYLVLKTGLTVSASIPIAVLSITLFRAFARLFGVRPATILENNIVQTTGSGGESIAFGVGVTMPAILILGYELQLARVMIVAALGGLLGILMMVPLRRALIVRQHGRLLYPEGTACADVLIVGEQGGTNARTVFTGFGVGLGYKLLMAALRLWKDTPTRLLGWYKGAALSIEVTPELLGVGYIIGPRISCIMVGGGVLASLVLIPAVRLFGDGLNEPLFPGTKLIRDMSVHDIWGSYILYIGAGAVAAGGIISLFQSLPTIIGSFSAALAEMRGGGLSGAGSRVARTERDLPMSVVMLGSLAIVLAVWAIPILHMNLLGAILIVLFGFLFVTVSSRITGEIGSSSNPISGMTVATLLLTCAIFFSLGWVGVGYRLTALSVAGIVCVAAANAGNTSQDLKTGFLVGATPRHQQVGLLIGALTSSLVIGVTLLTLNRAGTVYARRDFPGVTIDVSTLTEREPIKGPDAKRDSNTYHVLRRPELRDGVPPGKYLVDDSGRIRYLVDPGINGVVKEREDGTPVQKYDAPKARLMSLIIDGILTQKLPWGLVLIGVFISVVLELGGISALPFAVGVYLPLSTSTPIFVGGMVRWFVDRRSGKSAAESEMSPGVLLSSGYIAGGAIAGIGVALLALNEGWVGALDLSRHLGALAASDLWPMLPFALLVGFQYLAGRERLLAGKAPGR